MGNYRFPKTERLKKAGEIRQLFRANARYSVPGMRLLLKANGRAENRVLIAPSRGYPNAVQRNRAKRIGREIYRHIRNNLRKGYDLAIVIYPGDDSYSLRETQLRDLCLRAGILVSTGE